MVKPGTADWDNEMSHPLYELLNKLENANYKYSLSRNRPDVVSVEIAFVGERIEVDVFEDGHMEVSRFLGTEDVLGGKELVYDLIDKREFEDKIYRDKYSKKRKS